MFYIPRKIEQGIRFEGEELGYLFGLRYGRSIVIISKLRSRLGSSTQVSVTNRKLLDAVSRLCNEYEVVPYHTHSLERPSQEDLRTFYQLVHGGINYFAIGTPSKLLLYRGSILPNGNVLIKRERYMNIDLTLEAKMESLKLVRKLQELMV